MKLIRTIRSGLARIDGALAEFPPELGYEGSHASVHLATTIWRGKEPNRPEEDSSFLVDEAGRSDDEADDDSCGVDVGDRGFDPVFEIGADADERFPGLGGEAGTKIQQSVQLHGMDALGGYLSFHYPGLQWGIYVPISGMVYLIKHAFGDLSAPLASKIHLAFHAILNHELFHFATDYVIAQAELAHQEPWYVPASKSFRAGKPNYCVEEEQLANAYMLSAFRAMKPSLRVRGKQAALRSFVAEQPAGYRDALRIGRLHWDRLLEKLAHRYGSCAKRSGGHPLLWNTSSGYDWAKQFPIRPRIDWRYCPIHVVNDGARFGIPAEWLRFLSRLSVIKETAEFQKKLEKLGSVVQCAWERRKQMLGVAITEGADFKKWRKDLFTVRINDNFRAHLRRCKEPDNWLAVEIGNHKDMGHG